VVTEIGQDVTALRAGDHVVVSWANVCHRCFFCRSDQPELCEHGIDHAYAGPYATLGSGEGVWPGFGTATFAEATIVPEGCAIKIDPTFPLELAALVGCAVVTGAGAVRNSARVFAGQSVAVVGCGGVGLSAIQAASEIGAEPIVAFDRLDAKLTLARACGATNVVNTTAADALAAIAELPAVAVSTTHRASMSLSFRWSSRAMRRMSLVGTPNAARREGKYHPATSRRSARPALRSFTSVPATRSPTGAINLDSLRGALRQVACPIP
jgi:Zn-dependent alcohol dehydrogenase